MSRLSGMSTQLDPVAQYTQCHRHPLNGSKKGKHVSGYSTQMNEALF
jgi:hypothetical protein